MKNLMDEYIEFTTKKIKKYIKMIFVKKYNEEIVQEYLKTYINSRYYNINDEASPSRAFYLKITDALNRKEKVLSEKYQDDELIFVHNVKKVFFFILFFDNVRKIENFKNIKSIKQVIKQLIVMCKKEFGLKVQENLEEELYKEITSDMLSKDIYLDNFGTNDFCLDFEKCKEDESIYYTTLDYNIKLPMQYSDAAINKVYNTGIISEDKLEIEYILLNVVVIRDIINGNFKDTYIAEFSTNLFKKKQKIDSVLGIINNQALQDKILLNITYEEFIKNKNKILEYTKEGYNFVITLDDTLKDFEEVKKLKMFRYVLVPQNIKMHKLIMKNKMILSNVVEK